jgi:hypothetical protein
MTRLPNPLSVYLVPLGGKRFELYTEAVDDGPALPAHHASGRWQTFLVTVHHWWIGAVDAAGREGETAGWFERLKHQAVRATAETVAEQRTLWSLRHSVPAVLVHPADLTESAAATLRNRLLVGASRRHGWSLAVNGLAFVVSGALMPIPGPNLLAYYLAVRSIGHYLSWRGARCALHTTAWEARGEPALGELERLAAADPASRVTRVEAIARTLNLPLLPAFFARVTTPVR